MKIKALIQEERIALPELKEELQKIESIRRDSGKEMSYELRKSIEHATVTSKTSVEKSQSLVEALLKLEKMKPDIAYRIANIVPKTRDELRAIYAKERFTLTGEELDTILDLVSEHL